MIDLASDSDAVRIDGEELMDATGGAIASCDVNGDGIQDLVIGNHLGDGPDNSRGDCGEADLVLGRRSRWHGPLQITTSRTLHIMGQRTSDTLGWGVTCGDINADGYDDIVLCAPYADRQVGNNWIEGQAHVIFGSPSLAGEIDLLTDPGLVIYGGFYHGALCYNPIIADLNGDGTQDLVLDDINSLDYAETGKAGRVYVLFGRTTWPAEMNMKWGDADVTITSKPGDGFGANLTAGDLDQDGIDDLVISARLGDGPTDQRENCGDIHVFRGRSVWPSLIDLAVEWPDLFIYGVDPGDQSGASRGLDVGDIDSDGTTELEIGARLAWGRDNTGKYAGEFLSLELGETWPDPAVVDLATTHDLRIYGADSGDQFALTCRVGDLNGDGNPDLVNGAREADGPAESRDRAGELTAFLGPITFPADLGIDTRDHDLEIIGAMSLDKLQLSAVADLNGDGADEVVAASSVGSPDDVLPSVWLISPYDLDGDGITQLPDNCPLVANADQADSDGNNVGDACQGDWDGDGQDDETDCAPGNAAGGVPPEVTGLHADGDSVTTITWQSASFADEYDLHRGNFSQLSDSDYGSCQNDRDPDLTDTTFEEEQSPPAGNGFFFLVAGRNLACAVAGTLGATTSGEERTNSNPNHCP
ncbi:MAG: thrombospondin type 3 repeat-containing protein [Acidobacteriota bacterium]|nr:thrombospondin type 3 repeat-containing protein [Acidobacteriota bacterium]